MAACHGAGVPVSVPDPRRVRDFARASGTFRGQRHIHGGRTQARSALYMAVPVASRHNPVISGFYQRLRSNGKPPKLALTAAMRKLLIHLNSILKNMPPVSS